MVGVTDSVRVGGVVSTTVTICVSVAMWPLWSVTFQVTVVEPSGNTAGASLPTVGLGSQISLTVGVPSGGEAPPKDVHSTWTSGGATIVGGSVSWMVAEVEQLDEASPSSTMRFTGNAPVPANWTSGWTPLAAAPMNPPDQAYVSGSPLASEEPLPSSITLVVVPAHSATYGPPASHTGATLHPGSLKEVIRVLHPAALVVRMHSDVNQKVQSSTGSTSSAA